MLLESILKGDFSTIDNIIIKEKKVNDQMIVC